MPTQLYKFLQKKKGGGGGCEIKEYATAVQKYARFMGGEDSADWKRSYLTGRPARSG